MSKYELQKIFFKKSKKLLMTSFFWSRSWTRTLPVSVSKPKLRSRPVLVSEKFCGPGLGLGLGRVGLDYSPACGYIILLIPKCEVVGISSFFSCVWFSTKTWPQTNIRAVRMNKVKANKPKKFRLLLQKWCHCDVNGQEKWDGNNPSRKLQTVLSIVI